LKCQCRFSFSLSQAKVRFASEFLFQTEIDVDQDELLAPCLFFSATRLSCSSSSTTTRLKSFIRPMLINPKNKYKKLSVSQLNEMKRFKMCAAYC